MSATQRARSGVPLDMRSVLPSVPGVPWWGAILVAAGATLLGLAIDALRGDELTSTFSVFYFLGCTLAVAAVQCRGLFTTMVQPPLLLLVAVPLAQQMITHSATTGLKSVLLDIAYPLVNRFPVMLLATVVALIIGGLRTFLVKQRRTAPPRSTARRAARSPDAETRTAAPGRRASEPPEARVQRSRAARSTATARTTARPRAAAEPPRRAAETPVHPRRAAETPVHPHRVSDTPAVHPRRVADTPVHPHRVSETPAVHPRRVADTPVHPRRAAETPAVHPHRVSDIPVHPHRGVRYRER